jgi:hypothetical protein
MKEYFTDENGYQKWFQTTFACFQKPQLPLKDPIWQYEGWMAIPDEALLNILSSSSKKSFTFFEGER